MELETAEGGIEAAGTARGRAPSVHVGISGWRYPGWRGVFYPQKLPQRQELAYAASVMRSIEINGSFYALQRPESYRQWYADTPAEFVFAVKGSRFISHMKKLRGVEGALANFFASGVLALEEKLGPLLWQFPPNLGFDLVRFRDFLELLPRTTAEAAALAEGCDARLAERSGNDVRQKRPLRYAFEVRHPSFMTPAFMELLHAYGAAFVFADTAGRWPYGEDVTADFVYIRLHGAAELYASGYTDAELDWWAARIRAWHAGSEPPEARRMIDLHPCPGGRDVYVYFDNDAKVHAPFDALRLLGRVT